LLIHPLASQEKNLTRELSDAAIRFESFMTDNNNISKESGRETDKQSKSTSQNRLQVELDRYTKIGAIDKQVFLIARISCNNSSKSKPSSLMFVIYFHS
jgi:hypothetical protein